MVLSDLLYKSCIARLSVVGMFTLAYIDLAREMATFLFSDNVCCKVLEKISLFNC